MIDWHSHILPGMDDGSRNAAESISLLKMLSQQGIDTVVATPHFYANDERVDTFLERRQNSLEELEGRLPEGAPRILLGAEVRYYQGISRMPDLKKLKIERSKLLLLEMSFSKWTEYTIRELVELAGSSDMIVMLAHIERYLKFQSKEIWERLWENGITMQVNASFFIDVRTRRKALALLRQGKIQFIGSDCHNLTSRPPRMGEALDVIEKKVGGHFLNRFYEYGYDFLT